jgi:3-oxoadipate enol-lactonase
MSFRPVESGYLERPGFSLRYEAGGEGEPVLLLPGWTLNSHLWDPAADVLSERYKVIRLDPRGTGGSAAPSDLEYSLPADLEDASALLDHLGTGPVHVVGHSKGARVGAALALSEPKRVRSMVSVGFAEPHSPAGKTRRFLPIAEAWMRSVRQAAREEGPQAALAMIRSAGLVGKLHASPASMRLLGRAMEGYNADDLISTVKERELEIRGLESLRMPRMIVVGEDDPFLDECRQAHEMLPGSKLVVMEKCGHLPMLEKPERFTKILLDFLTEI